MQQVVKSRHPRALPYLFLTEMWERFGFYTVQGLLVLYMAKVFGFSDEDSFTISGIFAALVYISPIVGGYLADRLLGFKMAIVWGGFFLFMGYVLLALPSTHIFYLGLATIIVGNGLFKPNISSLLGALYGADDGERESGFTIFYIGINIGSMLAGLTSGFIKDHFGWHASYATAAVGIMLGLLVFAIGMRVTHMEYQSHLRAAGRWLQKPLLILYCIIAIVVISFLMQSHFLAKWLLPSLGVFLLLFLVYFTLKQDPAYRSRLITLNILIISSIVFWTLFLQIFMSANFYIDRLVDKQLFGMNIPTTVFYALEAFFIILLGPAFAWLWQVLAELDKNPSTIVKFVIAMFFIGLGFFVLSMSSHFHSDQNLVNPLWIVVSYLFVTIGELFLSPVGLSAVTMLAPPRLVGMMMGIWFVATGFGGQFAGWLAKLANVPDTIKDPALQLPIYGVAFMDFAYLAFGVAVILLVVYLLLRKRLQAME